MLLHVTMIHLQPDDNGTCTYADAGYDCNGACLNDVDGDGVCDEFELGGCTDATAYNYDSSAMTIADLVLMLMQDTIVMVTV